MQHGRSSRTEDTENWADNLFGQEPGYIRNARENSISKKIQQIALSAHEGKLLSLLLNLAGAKRIVEIGSLYGYSALWIAKNLPDDGKVFTFEADKNTHAVAEENFNSCPENIKSKIELLFGDARTSLQSIEDKGPFDAIFIDAMKFDYEIYLNWAEKNIKSGGLIIGDNTYMFGKLHLNPSEVKAEERPALTAMRNFNTRLSNPEKYESVLLPTGEGMTVAKKLF